MRNISLTKICACDVYSNMVAHRLCITLRPFIYDLISAKAKQRGVSISRQIEDCAEGFLVKDEADYEPDYVVTREEADRIVQKTLADPNNKTCDNLGDFFADLDHEVKKIR